MDKERAKFMLSAYRPGHEDQDDPEFAEALALAREDEELRRWLEDQRDFDREMIKRNQEIMIKLLESEKAERERDKDNKRRSEEAKEWELSNPSEYFEYQKKKESELELLKTVPLNLKPYYKNKVNEYFINFDQ